LAIINNDKINQVSLFAPLLFLAPEEKKPEEIEASKEINVSDDIQTETDDDGQITLSLE
jgi:topoisomerase-4 subunit A